MLLALDVHYEPPEPGCVATGLIGFESWSARVASFKQRQLSQSPAGEYEPGAFYKRELPYLLGAMESCPSPPTLIVIDGHVWLDADAAGEPRPGLGAHLHAAVGVPVVGVAKHAFANARCAANVTRGGSGKPLYVTSVGYELSRAVDGVQRMHGAHRIPELLKLVDQFARGRGVGRHHSSTPRNRTPSGN